MLAVVCCLAPPAAIAASSHRVTHVVILWLKRPGNANDRRLLVRASEGFRKLKGVTRVQTGDPLPVRRPGIEQSFDLAVIMTFKNTASLERFEKDRSHQEAVRMVLQPLVRRYIVYNVVTE